MYQPKYKSYTMGEILQGAKASGESEKDANQAKADRWRVGGMGHFWHFWAETLGLMVETHPVTVNRFDRTQDPQPMGYRFSARWLLVNRMAPKASQFFMDYVRCASNRYLWLYFTACIENNHRYTYICIHYMPRVKSRRVPKPAVKLKRTRSKRRLIGNFLGAWIIFGLKTLASWSKHIQSQWTDWTGHRTHNPWVIDLQPSNFSWLGQTIHGYILYILYKLFTVYTVYTVYTV